LAFKKKKKLKQNIKIRLCVNPKRKNVSKNKKKNNKSNEKAKAKNGFHFDRKIDLGHIISFIAIIIAFFTLRTSEKELKTKVEDLQEIVNRIDKADLERLNLETRGLNNSTSNLKHTNKAWDYITNSNRQFRKIMNSQFYESTLINEQLIEIALKNDKLTETERTNLKDYVYINRLNVVINQTVENHNDGLEKFEIDNEPKYDSLNIDLYSQKMKIYLKDLNEYVGEKNSELTVKMDSLTALKKSIYKKIFNR